MIKHSDIPRILKAYEDLKARYPKKRAIVYFLALNFKYTEKEIRGILPETPRKTKKVKNPVPKPPMPVIRLSVANPGENYRDIVDYLWKKYAELKNQYSSPEIWQVIDKRYYPFADRTGEKYEHWVNALKVIPQVERTLNNKLLTAEVPYRVRALA